MSEFLVFKLALILIVLVAMAVYPFLPKPPQYSVGMAAGTWDTGSLNITVVSGGNLSSLSPAELGFEIRGGGLDLFEGPAGSYSPRAGVTVTVSYVDIFPMGRVSIGDVIVVTVTPANYTAIHGLELGIRHQGVGIGYVRMP